MILISPYESGRNSFRWVLNVCVGNRFEITHRVLSNEETLNRGGVVCSSVVFLMPPLIFLEPTGAYYYNTYWHSDFEALWVRGGGELGRRIRFCHDEIHLIPPP